MKIIGIDPGTAIVGFSTLENKNGETHLIDYGCIRTPAGMPQNQRLQQIAEDIDTLVKKHKPERASIEKLYFKNNITTAMSVSEARGVIIQRLTENGINPNEYTPLEIKMSVCGYGKADKKMVQQMVKTIFNMKRTPQPDDAADAIAAGVCLSNSLALEQRINE